MKGIPEFIIAIGPTPSRQFSVLVNFNIAMTWQEVI